jgi:hypothetical protein
MPPAEIAALEARAGTLPIGVIVPTKNSAAFLPDHLASMREWLDLVQEVVVVDSFSTDGTPDLLRAGLAHPRLTVTSHPPGLYQSWNHAIAQVAAKYVYISTVGDSITRAGLQGLCNAAQVLAADVVLSKPRFVDAAGQPAPDLDWPIDDLVTTLQITQPRRLSRGEALLFALTNPNAAMLGSCASNLFRTEILQRWPFPVDFGTAGDGAWGIQHAADVSWAVVPERCSVFRQHPTNASAAERASYQRAQRLDHVARQAVAAARQAGLLTEDVLVPLRIAELLDALSVYLEGKQAFDGYRRGAWPWSLRPTAWAARSRRNRAQARLRELRAQALRALASRVPGAPPTH